MIDAIGPVYSSIHGGRGQNLTDSQTFDRSVKGLGDSFTFSKTASKYSRDWGGLLFVSGGIGAISFIADTLANASNLSGSNFDTMAKIAKNAGIWAIAGGILFCGFKFVERLCLGSK
ncbi:MAG: hypothetical protein K6A44_03475 [bacterium]|nr:hypothetical protein [bacterium]